MKLWSLPPFTHQRDELFTEGEYLEFQWYLCNRPEAGDVIPNTDGCRKVRWKAQGKGKRGGARVIYFLRISQEQIVLMVAYGKNEREDISRDLLRKLKERYLHEQGQ